MSHLCFFVVFFFPEFRLYCFDYSLYCVLLFSVYTFLPVFFFILEINEIYSSSCPCYVSLELQARCCLQLMQWWCWSKSSCRTCRLLLKQKSRTSYWLHQHREHSKPCLVGQAEPVSGSTIGDMGQDLGQLCFSDPDNHAFTLTQSTPFPFIPACSCTSMFLCLPELSLSCVLKSLGTYFQFCCQIKTRTVQWKVEWKRTQGQWYQRMNKYYEIGIEWLR